MTGSSATAPAHEMHSTTPASGCDEDTWSVVDSDWSDPDAVARGRALFTLGDGFLGVRGCFEEDWPQAGGPAAVYLNGVYETVPITYHEKLFGFATSSDTRLPAANALPVEVVVGGHRFSLTTGAVLGYRRMLDLRRGLLTRDVCWRAPDGQTLQLRFERAVGLARRGVLAIRVSISAVDFDGEVAIHSRIDAAAGRALRARDAEDPRLGPGFDGDPWSKLGASPAVRGAVLGFEQCAFRSGHRVAVAATHACPGAVRRGISASELVFTGRLQRGETLTLTKACAYVDERDGNGAPIQRRARTNAQDALDDGFDAIVAENHGRLQAFWSGAAPSLDEEPGLERALRFNMFQMHQAVGRDGRTSISAKGQSGEGYEGHYFWDAEIFCLPMLAFTDPVAARSILEFRWRTLAQARALARTLGHARGALFPWRTLGGTECSAYFPAGTAQYHINAAVAHAVRQYWEATGDDAFLHDHGAELVLETARIWLEVGFFNERQGGAFCIPGVTGPDEYTALVDNNLYTNVMAQAHLEFACELLEHLRRTAPEAYARLERDLAIAPSEPAAWAAAAAHMRLPYDPGLGVFGQDDSFLDRKPWAPGERPHAHEPLLLRHHPLVLYRHRVCKQADAVLAMFLQARRFNLPQRARTFDFYETLTVHDSALSPGIFAIVAADTGRAVQAADYARRTLRIDLDDLHGNTRDGLHMAALGASWMVLTHGFAGLRMAGDVLEFSPRTAPGFERYSFRLRYHGAVLSISVAEDRATYACVGDGRVDIRHGRRRVTVDGSAPVVLPLGDPKGVPPSRSEFDAVLFDLDGVLADTARLHRRSWQRLAREIGLPLPDDLAEHLKGVDRQEALRLILRHGGREACADEQLALASRKNAYYRELIADLGPDDALPGAHAALRGCRSAGLRIAVASASRNAPALLDRLGFGALVDAIADPAAVPRGKPDPGLFLEAARLVGAAPARCVALDDAVAGVAAIRAAGMFSVGVGDPAQLAAADLVVGSASQFVAGLLEPDGA